MDTTDIAGTNESAEELAEMGGTVPHELHGRICDALDLNVGSRSHRCPNKLTRATAIGELTISMTELANGPAPDGETEVWQEVMETAYARLGTLVADRWVRLEYEPGDEPEDPEELVAGESFVPEQ